MPAQTTRWFESLLEAVPDALVGMDQKGVIRFVNRQAESLFGYNRDQLTGQPIETLVPESLWQIYAEHWEDYFADPRARSSGLNLELGGRQQDGTELPLDVSLSQVDTGDVLLVISAVRDVNRQKQSVRNAQLIEAVVEYSADAITSSTLDGVITSWNPAAERLYGYSSTEIIGKSVDLPTPKDRAGEMEAMLAKIKAEEHVENFETIRVRKDGTLFRAALTISPIRDVDGTIIGASSIARDVTEARQAFDAERSMIESSPDLLVAISAQGMITDLNEATVKVTGVPRDELIGTAFSDYFTDPDKANRIYKMVFAKGMAMDYPMTMRSRDGTLTEVLYNASVRRDVGGKVLGVFAAARDVTKQVHAQKESAEQKAWEMERLAERERIQRLTVACEVKLIELKKEIESLGRLVLSKHT
jgi:PAS domain S-box-containing protein